MSLAPLSDMAKLNPAGLVVAVVGIVTRLSAASTSRPIPPDLSSVWSPQVLSPPPDGGGCRSSGSSSRQVLRQMRAANGIGQMDETAIELPPPLSDHATCAWCGRTLATIVEQIDHIDAGHLPAAAWKAERGGRA